MHDQYVDRPERAVSERARNAADDFEAYYRVHAGLKGPESDWVLLSREANRDVPVGSSLQGSSGNSEVCMRNMYQAWGRYMSAQ